MRKSRDGVGWLIVAVVCCMTLFGALGWSMFNMSDRLQLMRRQKGYLIEVRTSAEMKALYKRVEELEKEFDYLIMRHRMIQNWLLEMQGWDEYDERHSE